MILYEGPSCIDGEPIVVIATFKTENAKIGKTFQTWILRRDVNPIEAIETGDDYSICGNCQHRGTSCYVRVDFAPRAIWLAYKRGSYRHVKPEDIKLFSDCSLRIGAYGDPTAVPFELWESIAKACRSWTGYTHQWKNCDQRFKSICMASVDSYAEYREATHRGWRTFRVRVPSSKVYAHENVCGASKEAGRKITCDKCGRCCGTRFGTGRKLSNVTIVVHGGAISSGIFCKRVKDSA